jgi:hypothetical protein
VSERTGRWTSSRPGRSAGTAARRSMRRPQHSWAGTLPLVAHPQERRVTRLEIARTEVGFLLSAAAHNRLSTPARDALHAVRMIVIASANPGCTCTVFHVRLGHAEALTLVVVRAGRSAIRDALLTDGDLRILRTCPDTVPIGALFLGERAERVAGTAELLRPRRLCVSLAQSRAGRTQQDEREKREPIQERTNAVLRGAGPRW